MSAPSHLVDTLHRARRDGLGIEVDPAPGLSLDAALSTQLEVLARFEHEGRQLGGWKAALSTGTSRDLMGLGFRPFGYVLKDRVLRSGAKLQRARIHRCKIEPELCVIMGAPLHGDSVDAADARNAIQSIAPAFEVNELRVARGLPRPLLLADGLANWGIVIGPAIDLPTIPSLDLTNTRVTLCRNGSVLTDVTPGDSMDDPFLSVARMCRLLHRYGLGLTTGQPVITGSFCHQDIEKPGFYTAVFSGIGSVELSFD